MAHYSDRYKELGFLGRGVTGRVIHVLDTKTGRHCALKILQSIANRGVDRVAYRNFQSEFEILKNLNHPYIAAVYDTGYILDDDPDLYDDEDFEDVSKQLYIVTEFVKGTNLYDAAEKFSIKDKELLFVQALRALNYIHEQKVYHLDIKPQNFIVALNNHNKFSLKLIDFGFANFYDRQIVKEKKNQGKHIIAGTSPYIAPEIIKGESYDGRTDLYSLGCTFYKVFADKPPFTGKSHAEFHEKHLFEMPKPPATLNPEIPEYLNTILLKLMAKEPNQRYSTAAEVIEDLNLRSDTTYEVETSQTTTSYVPEKGNMIGRKDQVERFKNVYNDRLYVQSYKEKPYLLVKGKTGAGKSRFLAECKNKAQKQFIKVLDWHEFKEYEFAEDVPTPCLVIGDDIEFDSYDLQFLEAFFQDRSVLAILTTSQDDLEVDPNVVIELSNFNLEETKQYLLKAMSLEDVPNFVIETIFKNTHGNPLLLTGYLIALFEKGYFRDSQGKWSEKVLLDLGMNLENQSATQFIKKNLKQRLNTLNLEEHQYTLLYTMALADQPSLQNLGEMTGGSGIENELVSLVKSGILEKDSNHQYVFSNPLFKEVLLQNMPYDLRCDICDDIVNNLEVGDANEEKFLFFKGLSHAHDAVSALMEYAKVQKEQLNFFEAKKSLKFVFENPNATQFEQNKTWLQLAEIEIDLGNFNQAKTYLEKILRQSDLQVLTHIMVLEKLGIIAYNQGNLKSSTSYFEQGLELSKNSETPILWMDIILKGRIAQNEFDLGHHQKAEEILVKTFASWKNDLNEDEQILAAKNNMDTIYYAKGEYQKAIDFLQEYLKVISKKPHLESYPSILYKLGRSQIKLGKIEEGEKLLRDCLELMKERHASHWLYLVYNELGILSEQKNNFKEALYHYKHAFDLAKIKNVGLNFFAISKNLAQVHLKLENYIEAEKYFDFSIRNLEKEKNKKLAAVIHYRLYHCYLGMADLNSKRKEFSKAHGFLQKAKTLLEKEKSLDRYAQYYWQQLIEVLHAQNKKAEIQKANEKLENIKTTDYFDEDLYKKFLENTA